MDKKFDQSGIRLLWFVSVFLFILLFYSRFSYLSDPMVDVGSEMYISAQINQGKVLYRDLFYLHGPFTPYFHAVVIKFIPTIRTAFAISNILFFTGILACIALLLSPLVNAIAIPLAILYMIVIHGFNQTELDGNFNFLFPYRSSVSQALFFSLLSYLLISTGAFRSIQSRRSHFVWLGGAIGALVFFTKAEFFVAYLIPISWIGVRYHSNVKKQYFALYALGFFSIIFVGFLLFHFSLGFSVSNSIEWMFYPYLLLSKIHVLNHPFYQGVRGIMGKSSFTMILSTLLSWLGIFGLMFFVLDSKSNLKYRLSFLSAFGLIFLVSCHFFNAVFDLAIGYGRITPFVSLVLFLTSALKYRKSAFTHEKFLLETLSLFSVCLALKVIFNADGTYYSFVLALPSMVIFFLLYLEILSRKFKDSYRIRLLIGLLFLPHAVCLHQNTFKIFAKKTAWMESEIGGFYYFPSKAKLLVAIVQTLQSKYDWAETITFLPEGHYLNLILKKPTPLRAMSLLPDQVLILGGQSIANQMTNLPADVVVLLPRDASEFESGSLETGYGKLIFNQIESFYCRDTSLQNDLEQGGVKIYYRNSSCRHTSALRFSAPYQQAFKSW